MFLFLFFPLNSPLHILSFCGSLTTQAPFMSSTASVPRPIADQDRRTGLRVCVHSEVVFRPIMFFHHWHMLHREPHKPLTFLIREADSCSKASAWGLPANTQTEAQEESRRSWPAGRSPPHRPVPSKQSSALQRVPQCDAQDTGNMTRK